MFLGVLEKISSFHVSGQQTSTCFLCIFLLIFLRILHFKFKWWILLWRFGVWNPGNLPTEGVVSSRSQCKSKQDWKIFPNSDPIKELNRNWNQRNENWSWSCRLQINLNCVSGTMVYWMLTYYCLPTTPFLPSIQNMCHFCIFTVILWYVLCVSIIKVIYIGLKSLSSLCEDVPPPTPFLLNLSHFSHRTSLYIIFFCG